MISIIGAGVSGNYAAYLLAKNGFDVSVFEEHDVVGEPVQCTGLVTSAIKDFMDIDSSFIVNVIFQIKVIAPNSECVYFDLEKPNYVLDRCKLDQYLYNLAEKEGVKYYLGKKFKSFDGKRINFEDSESFDADYLVGADGIFSSVAKQCGMFDKRTFMTGLQALVKGEFDPHSFVVYLGKNYFGWSVPESESKSRVGVICTSGEPQQVFQSLLNKLDCKIIKHISGLIPVYQPDIKCQKDNVFLIGDAATHCKASTHGGIVQGVIGASALCDSFVNGGSYDKLWRKKMGRDLGFHLRIKRVLDKFNEKDLNYLVKIAQQEKVKKILEQHDRDYVFSLAVRLFLKKPGLLRFIFKA